MASLRSLMISTLNINFTPNSYQICTRGSPQSPLTICRAGQESQQEICRRSSDSQRVQRSIRIMTRFCLVWGAA